MSVLGDIAGLGSMASGFMANIINRQQNAEQLRFAQRQFEAQQRQASYSYQRNNMQAAGLNPALMFANGQSGLQASTVGNPSFNPQSQVSASDFIASQKQDQEQKLVDAQKENLDEDTRGKEIENDVKKETLLQNLENLRMEYKKAGRDVKYLDELIARQIKENAYFDDVKNYRLERERGEMELSLHQATGQDIANDISLINKRFANSMAQQELKLRIAQTLESISRKKLNYSQSKAALMDSMRINGVPVADEKEREKFAIQALNNLRQQELTMMSEEFNNYKINHSDAIGSSVYGTWSHSGQYTDMQYYQNHNWKPKYNY